MDIQRLYKDIREYHRVNYFCALINAFQLKLGVEVGVRFGVFSRDLMESSSLTKLIGIDYDLHKDAIQTDKDYAKYQLMCGRSPDCASLFTDNSLCLVYLDNDHHYAHVKAELPVWYEKVKVGGILSGHDFMEYTDSGEGKFGVDDAVIEFCRERNYILYVSGCDSNNLDNLKEFSVAAGENCKNKREDQRATHEDVMVPNWWLVKQ